MRHLSITDQNTNEIEACKSEDIKQDNTFLKKPSQYFSRIF